MNDLIYYENMDKGKTCKTCCKLKESINGMGRCETCQARIKASKKEYSLCKENVLDYS